MVIPLGENCFFERDDKNFSFLFVVKKESKNIQDRKNPLIFRLEKHFCEIQIKKGLDLAHKSEMMCDCQGDSAIPELFLSHPSVRWAGGTVLCAPAQRFMCARCFLNAEVVMNDTVPQLVQLYALVSNRVSCEVAKIVVQYFCLRESLVYELLYHGSWQLISVLIPPNIIANDLEAIHLLRAAKELDNPKLLTLVDLDPMCALWRASDSFPDEKECLQLWLAQNKWGDDKRDLAQVLLSEDLIAKDDFRLVQLAAATGHYETIDKHPWPHVTDHMFFLAIRNTVNNKNPYIVPLLNKKFVQSRNS